MKTPEQILEYWQGVLRLRDWRISIRTKRYYDMQGPVAGSGEAAHIVFRNNDKTGQLTLMDTNDFDPEEPGIPSIEQSIVHELLHIHLDGWEPEVDSPEYWNMECAINIIADALVELNGLRET